MNNIEDDDMISMVSDDILSHLDSIPNVMKEMKERDEPTLDLQDLAYSDDFVAVPKVRNRFKNKVFNEWNKSL